MGFLWLNIVLIYLFRLFGVLFFFIDFIDFVGFLFIWLYADCIIFKVGSKIVWIDSFVLCSPLTMDRGVNHFSEISGNPCKKSEISYV